MNTKEDEKRSEKERKGRMEEKNYNEELRKNENNLREDSIRFIHSHGELKFIQSLFH